MPLCFFNDKYSKTILFRNRILTFKFKLTRVLTIINNFKKNFLKQITLKYYLRKKLKHIYSIVLITLLNKILKNYYITKNVLFNLYKL